MLWDATLIAKLLELYKDNQVLWDPKHPDYANQDARFLALQGICEELGLNISPNDIHKKYKTLRGAYQVEMRKINAAKLRGFFYKPTLYWFDEFHKFTQETEDMKIQDEVNILVQAFKPSTKKPTKRKNRVAFKEEIKASKVILPEEVTSDEASSESEDEFQTFADHIAEQLRGMSVHRAVMIQNQIQRLFARDREIEDEIDDVEYILS